MRIVIVGGGVIGLMMARELLGAGQAVRLVERRGTGQEASWAGGGIVSPLWPWRYPPAVTALAAVAQSAYPELAAALAVETGIDPELSPCGMLLVDSEDERDALAWAEAYDRPMSRVTGLAALRELEPGLGEGFHRGLWMPYIANVRNPRLLAALRASVLARGGEITEHDGVAAIETQGGRASAVRLTSGEQIAGDQIILATGAWTAALLAPFGLSLPIRPMRGQMLLYETAPGTLQHIVLAEGRYLIPRRDGHVLCGSTTEDVGFDTHTTAEARALLQGVAQRILPVLAQQAPVAHWAGLRPGSPNGIPWIGPVPGVDGLWVNAGHYRNGLVLAPASARLLVDLLLGRAPALDPAPYRVQ